MKKLIALLLAALMVLALAVPALAEAVDTAAEDAQETVEEAAGEAADTAETVAEEAAEEAADTAEAVVEEAAGEAEEAVEEAEEPAEEPSVSPIIKKLVELPWYSWALVAVLAIAGVILALSSARTNWTSHRIAMGAMCIAIAFVLSCIRLYRMPQGGSITPASMLPLVLFMVACGPLQGFVVGCAFGLLKLVADPYIIHPVQMLLDYPLSYGALILGCLAVLLPINKRWQLPVAVLLAGVGRYIMAVLSGSIFFAEYAGEQNAWIYSLVYNIGYIGVDVVVCMLVACIPGMTRLVDMIRGKK